MIITLYYSQDYKYEQLSKLYTYIFYRIVKVNFISAKTKHTYLYIYLYNIFIYIK